MIDTIALVLGHGLLALALLRLAMREDLDRDPLLGAMKDEADANRMDASAAGRNAGRRAAAEGAGPENRTS